jgi:hypothetical protein
MWVPPSNSNTKVKSGMTSHSICTTVDQAISQNPVRGYFLLIYSHERTDNRLVEKAQTRRPTFWLWVFIVALAALIWPWAHRLYGPGWRK